MIRSLAIHPQPERVCVCEMPSWVHDRVGKGERSVVAASPPGSGGSEGYAQLERSVQRSLLARCSWPLRCTTRRGAVCGFGSKHRVHRPRRPRDRSLPFFSRAGQSIVQM